MSAPTPFSAGSSPPSGAAPGRPPMALFALGFRPFFLLTALGAIALIARWVFVSPTGTVATAYGGGSGWHAHEMIFGVAGAVIAGFLLTAVKNWTKRPTLTGVWLMALVAVWIGARVASWFPAAPWLRATLDLGFWAFLFVAVARPIIAAKSWRNLRVLAVLILLAAANALMHFSDAGLLGPDALPALSTAGMTLGMWAVLIMIAIIGGRVMPFFTRARLKIPGREIPREIEVMALPTLLTVAICEAVGAPGVLTATMAFIALIFHGARFGFMIRKGALRVPLLSVLFVAYAWLLVGLVLVGIAAVGAIPSAVARHALTIGTMGGFILGMMVRVSLGHTGRPLKAPKSMVAAFVLLNVAALIRVLGPIFAPTEVTLTLHTSGGLWMLAFILFLIVNTPILVSARPDGRLG